MSYTYDMLTILVSIAVAALGAVLASFIGVIAERLYTGQSWLKGRSRCNACNRQLTFVDLIPIFSWSIFGGRCRMCRARLPVRYILFEIAFAVVFVLSYLKLGLTIPLATFLAALAVLGFIVMYDLRHTIVPIGSIVLLSIFSLIFAALTSPSIKGFLIICAIAVVLGLVLFALYFFSKGRAMGFGDAPVAFALSLLIGSQAFVGLVFAFWIGALIGIGILVKRRGGPTMGIEVPFVPFLAAGYLLAFFTQWNPFLF